MLELANEKIVELFVEEFCNIVGAQPEDFIKSGISPVEGIIERQEDHELFPFWIAEAITQTVNRIVAERLSLPVSSLVWHFDAPYDDQSYVRTYLFIAVERKNRRCVTASDDCSDIAMEFVIDSEDELIDAIKTLVETVTSKS